MESVESAANMELSTTFSQVVFQEIPHSYAPNLAVICCYTLTAAIQQNPRDWVGIFKVGWSTTKDYYTFVWVEPSLDPMKQDPNRKQVVFSAYYLPKDDAEFYQFCYVDSNGQVRGASTPFCFKTSGEQSTDGSLENDLLVITTQEKVEQREREKEKLVMELGQLKEQNEILRGVLKEQQQEIDCLKLSNEELYQADGNLEKQQQNAREHEELTHKAKSMDDSHKGQEEQVAQSEMEKEELAMELGQLKEQNETLTSALKEQQQEVDRLKESKEELAQVVSKLEQQQHNAREHEELTQNAKSMDESHIGQESLTPTCEKYERALSKIKQLKKEQVELKGKVEVQSLEIAQLSPRLSKSEQESYRLKDHIQLLQVDLQSSEKEKEKLSAELHKLRGLTHDLEDLKTENKALHRSLSEQEHQPQQEMVDSDLKVQYQALLGQLQEAQTQLHQELHASNNTRRRAEQAEGELEKVNECMKLITIRSTQAEQKTSKLEMQLLELHRIIEEKESMTEIAKVEKEELSRENQELKITVVRLRKEFADLQAAPVSMQHPNPYGSSTDPIPTEEQQQQDALAASLHFGNPYETPGPATNPEELSLKCRHCHECFPGITPNELELHEDSHRVCPFCTLICDGLEQTKYEEHVYSHEV
ncbi:calcium-binding and coiled-coil domain-containing protein 2-like [Coregonus clupeaformis]|uniref:calcium-binding and coiled-coil domain-containing protein 2-like n=1 Tax=Coregonus clupeaformis TaxID=59861 RepID=UPI001BE0B780|nr:calcium-binding and coiled-coil domain-containing protein 2-like [Coregonus clupeaformis]